MVTKEEILDFADSINDKSSAELLRAMGELNHIGFTYRELAKIIGVKLNATRQRITMLYERHGIRAVHIGTKDKIMVYELQSLDQRHAPVYANCKVLLDRVFN